MRKIALQYYQKLKQVTKLSHAGASIKKSRTWSATCLRPGLRQVGDLVSDKIDLMEFGHN